jgi:hypothetical protein
VLDQLAARLEYRHPFGPRRSKDEEHRVLCQGETLRRERTGKAASDSIRRGKQSHGRSGAELCGGVGDVRDGEKWKGVGTARMTTHATATGCHVNN